MKYRDLNEYFAEARGNQIALARQVGCKQGSLSLLAKGKRRPSPRLAAKIEAVTGIPLRTLLGLDEYQSPVGASYSNDAQPKAGTDEAAP